MGYETDLKLFIDGVWKSGEGRDAHTVLNPVNASPIAEVPYATKADLEEALEASNRAGRNGDRWTSRSAGRSCTRRLRCCVSALTSSPQR